MNKTFRQGAIGALLDEYEKAILELQEVLIDISDQELQKIVDTATTDESCKSIQTILSHVVRSGYGYAIYIQKPRNHGNQFPNKVFHSSIKNYQQDLIDFFLFTVGTLSNIQDKNLEEFDDNKKILTSWGQIYDTEQILEHAIVHILRHRRQIEKFKIALRA